jgi:hypothetical protein
VSQEDKMRSRRDIVEDYCLAAGIENAVFIDGKDDALLGVAYQANEGPWIIYDRKKIIDALTDEFDGDEDAALEYVEFNIDAAYVGPLTPMLLVSVEYMAETDDGVDLTA